MKSEQQIRQEISALRKQLRGIKQRRLGIPTKRTSYRRGEHEYLVGTLAFTRRRLEIFRNAGGEATWFDESDPSSVEEIRPAQCQACPDAHNVGWEDGQWHHACPLRKHCDAAKCGMFICGPAHQILHGRIIRWSPKRRASGGD